MARALGVRQGQTLRFALRKGQKHVDISVRNERLPEIIDGHVVSAKSGDLAM